MKNKILFLFAFLLNITLSAQTANVQKGCSPLKVEFKADGLLNYFWDFGDLGSNSIDQNPEHVFTDAGNYMVKLYDGQGGNLIGSIEITVYADPIIKISGSPRSGCSPLEVDFNSTITIDPELNITSYLWAFGDGNFSTVPNPAHRYTNSGNYTVLLELTVDLNDCSKTEAFIEYVVVNGVEANFEVDKLGACAVPAEFTLTNKSEFNSENEYFWDFGDGNTSSEYDPGIIQYLNKGNYEIKLSVTNDEGCTSVFSLVVTVGKLEIDMQFPEVACLGDTFEIVNNGLGRSHLWDLDETANIIRSRQRLPIISYDTAGIKFIRYRMYNNPACISDTTFTLEIQDPDSRFVVEPLVSCKDPSLVTLSALQKDYKKYHWFIPRGNIFLPNEPEVQYSQEDFERDSLHWNRSDTSFIRLRVETEFGCMSSDTLFFIFDKPNAHFLPSKSRGCAPLLVTFNDASISRAPILNYEYFYGNGDSKILNTSDPHSYIFTEPGEYFVKNSIVNEDGCIDTSAGVWILVGEALDPDFTIDKTEICIEESITASFVNTDDRIDAWYLFSDEGRFDHCWKDMTATHQFKHSPGEFTVKGVVEYNGCYNEITYPEKIVVKGAKADMNYMTNCNKPFDVMFLDSSINSNQTLWIINGDSIFNQDILTYRFDTTGDYNVRLKAWETESGCPATTEFKKVFIRTIKADFELDSTVCDNEIYQLDASASIDVDNDCCKGYLWNFDFNRPIELGWSTLPIIFPSGNQPVRLIVEDINGCTDTLTKTIQSFGIEADFKVPEAVCFPAEFSPVNNTVSDTTILNYTWSGGYQGKEPVFYFTSPNTNDSLSISLYLEDALGCRDTTSTILSTYKVRSQMFVAPGSILCVGDSLTFYASDFTGQGSFLNFNWDLDSFGTYNERYNKIELDKAGEFFLSLKYTEDSSGCSDSSRARIQVVDVPEAKFESDADGLGLLCFPRIINFTNLSDLDGAGYFVWKTSDGNLITEENPSLGFVRGEHLVELVVYSEYGCADSISNSYILVGPEGDAFADKSKICVGDEITFTMIDTIDVTSYEWDFGDGNTIENTNPITYQYDRELSSTAKLILKGVESNCNVDIEIPLYVGTASADFAVLDTLNYCEGWAFVQNRSEGASSFDWSFPGADQVNHDDPIRLQYPSAGNYNIRLVAFDSLGICSDTASQFIDISEIGELYAMPNVFTPNGDGNNDYFRPVFINPDNYNHLNVITFQIYNRWGNLVYDNQNPAMGWDGNFKGAEAPAEVYAYYLSMELIGCQVLQEKGNVTLIR